MSTRRQTTPKYGAIHQWLRYHYGAPSHCERKGCSGKSKQLDYALKKGCRYAYKRDSFIQLCRSCHARYDGVSQLMSKLMWKGGLPKCRACPKRLSQRHSKTGLCRPCKDRQFVMVCDIRNVRRKLSAEQVRQAREDLKVQSIRSVAKKYGLNYVCMRRIFMGEAYTTV